MSGSPLDLFLHVRRFHCSDVEDAPSTPGIYAWYSVMNLGPKDWEFENEDGQDKGIARLKTALARHSARFAVPPLEVSAVGRFTASWRGRIDSDGSQQMSLEVNKAAPAEEIASLLERVFSAPDLRKSLVRLLDVATPLLAAPLYIGVSDNLRRRLKEHVHYLHKCADVVARDPKARERLLEADKKFAFRAIGSGFAIENLQVWTLDLTSVFEKQLPENDLRELAEAAEWFLNRWYRPLHGKR